MTKIIAEYVWLGGNRELRSKARTIDLVNGEVNLNDYISKGIITEWNYDGSSTGQADGNNSEILLVPRAIFRCPFRTTTGLNPNKFHHVLVMCDTFRYLTNDVLEPTETNTRVSAKGIFDEKLESKPWFGIEQEFFIINLDTQMPAGFPKDGENLENPQGQYYCSVGAENSYGRQIVDQHYYFCLYAGINISGINAEVACGQWEYQVGPCEGIDAGDQLWMSRYILQRVAERYNVGISFEPKPVKGNWNGSGCHTNYSTEEMRRPGNNMNIIDNSIQLLAEKHMEHMNVYGTGNELRMTGEHETSSFDKFTYGVADRSASVRIPRKTNNDKRGYIEDRRPSSNMDPWLVTSKIFETTMLSDL